HPVFKPVALLALVFDCVRVPGNWLCELLGTVLYPNNSHLYSVNVGELDGAMPSGKLFVRL
ncbi:hypothetical protein GGI19_006822, partial [Coemansia pectinata]